MVVVETLDGVHDDDMFLTGYQVVMRNWYQAVIGTKGKKSGSKRMKGLRLVPEHELGDQAWNLGWLSSHLLGVHSHQYLLPARLVTLEVHPAKL